MSVFKRILVNLWTPDSEDEKYVTCVGRMALDALASNGVKDRETFIANLEGIARCLRKRSRSERKKRTRGLR